LVTQSLSNPVTDIDPQANSPSEELGAHEARLRSLMAQALRGDELAYRTLLQDLSERLRAFFRRRLQGIAIEVEDLVQETLLAIHIQRHTYDASRPLTAWCYAIARYKLVDLLRRRGRREALTEPFSEADEMLHVRDDEPSNAQRDLAQLLHTLPERQRLAIVAVKIDGHSIADTAERTGMSPSAVKVNVHRGLKTLAAKIRSST